MLDAAFPIGQSGGGGPVTGWELIVGEVLLARGGMTLLLLTVQAREVGIDTHLGGLVAKGPVWLLDMCSNLSNEAF